MPQHPVTVAQSTRERPPATVLGIDPAWTQGKPSGVALVQRRADQWRVIAVAPSYSSFMGSAQGQPVDWLGRQSAGLPEIKALLDAARTLSEAHVDVIAADIPMAKRSIVGRRVADDAVSRAYGGRGCGTHSPSAHRPGQIATAFRDDAERRGYQLATTAPTVEGKALVETYPHPAILELLRADYRVPYKVTKIAKYWPHLMPEARREKVSKNLFKIVNALEDEIGACCLPTDRTLALTTLKHIEDAIDALVCCWVGVRWLEGSVRSYGDEDAAIWLPTRHQPVTPVVQARASHG